MFLKRIELFGFKSFADRTVIDFTDGVTALLGPNGCGKSNVVDSIKWVLGEQSIKNMRAEKMEDVIFNGTEARKALNVAEVSLTIGNEQGYLDLDVSEISIKRRLYRSGESEYYINNTLVRLKEIREIFFDTGVGKSAYSIMEQGKIDQLISNKPDERRAVFEEAAGVTKYKAKRSEAERKLEQTEQNMENVENILSEVRKQYETLKIQSEKTIKYRALQEKIFQLDLDLSLIKLKKLIKSKEKKVQTKEKKNIQFNSYSENIKELNDLLKDHMEKISEMETSLNENQKKLYGMEIEKDNHENQTRLLKEREAEFEEEIAALKSRLQSIEVRRESARKEKKDKEQQSIALSSRLDELEKNIVEYESLIKQMEEEIIANRKEIKEKEDNIRNQEYSREELQISLKKLTDDIVQELDKGLRDSSFSIEEKKDIETQIKSKLENIYIQIEGKSSLLDDSLSMESLQGEKLKEIIEVQSGFLKELLIGIKEVDVNIEQLKKLTPDFLQNFLAPEGIVTRKRELDTEIGQILRKVKENRSRIESLTETNRDIIDKNEEYRKILSELKVSKAELSTQAEALKESLGRISEDLFAIEESHKDVQGLSNGYQKKVEEIRERLTNIIKEQDGLNREKENIIKELGELDSSIKDSNSEIQDKQKQLETKRNELNDISLILERLQIEIEHIDEQIDQLHKDFREKYAKILEDYAERLEALDDSTNDVKDKLSEVKQESRKLEYGLNFMAPEEFQEVEERYNFLNSQLKDLMQAKDDLVQVTNTIKSETEALFLATYEKIKVNFHEMFRKLFGGGRADIQLVNKENILVSGIEIYAQPPGKKLENISLLSGGEKSLTAISLLFAIFMVKPSPFCILDEIDAALDEANIQRFVDLLADFQKKSQFIIITHSKRTVTGAATLLGVTMQESGVSTTISMRIEDETDKQESESEA